MRTLAIIIPTHYNMMKLKNLLTSIAAHKTEHNIITVVVDNASMDGTAAMLADWKEYGSNRFVVWPGENLGYGQGANAGIECINHLMHAENAEPSCDPDFLVLNDDMLLMPFCLDNLMASMTRAAKVGIVGGKLFYDNGIIQHAGAFLNEQYIGTHYGQMLRTSDYTDCTRDRVMNDFEFVTGALFLMSGEMLRQIGGFDPAFGLGYYEDADMCYRARAAGWQVIYNPNAHAIHHEGQTSGRMGEARSDLIRRNRNIFITKYAIPDWEDA